MVPSPFGDGKLWALPGIRDLDSPVLGLLQETLRATSDRNPNFAGWIDQSLGQVLPPGIDRPVQALAKGDIPGAITKAALAPLGTVGTIAGDLASNRTWMGTPIVPRRSTRRRTSSAN